MSHSKRKTGLQIGSWTLAVVASVTFVGRSSGAPAQNPSDKPAKAAAKTSEELPVGTMKETATTACTECHDSSIILQQRLSKAAWTKTVDKMIKWGAIVDAKDHDPLIDYLSTNFSPDKPPYEPSKTAADKSGAAKGSK